MKFLWRIFQIGALLAALFIGFNWASIRLYSHYGFAGYQAVLGGMILGSLVLFLILSLLHKWVFGKLGSLKGMQWRGLFTVGTSMAIGLFLLVHVSGANAKSDAVASEYRELHPVMRTSVGALVLVNKSLIVTDASRQPQDYDNMGFARYAASNHFHQEDGYVHAVDIRTIGMTESRNRLVENYFKLLGFRTLRHVGTADHLHVEMPMVR